MLEQAKQLVSQKKYKKALVLVKKLNQQVNTLSFASLELESGCLFYLKRYKLSSLRAQQSLTFAANLEQKLGVLSNLAACYEKLHMPPEAIAALKQVLEIDGSLNTADKRYSLIRLAFSVGDYDTVENNGQLLCKLSEYSIQTLLLLAQTAINTKNYIAADKYLSRLVVEIRTECRADVEQQNIIAVLNGFHHIEAYGKEQELLNFLEAKFKHEPWFANVETRLQGLKNKPGTKRQKINKPPPEPALTVANITGTTVSGNTVSTVKTIEKLKLALEAMGASFNNSLRICEHNGDIKVSCATDNELSELLMDVPIHCVPLINDYRFSLDKDGQLLSKAKNKMLNPRAQHIMHLLTVMYNACDKLNSWKVTHPLFALAGRENVLSKLFAGRTNPTEYASFYAGSPAEISDAALIKSFIGSRAMAFTRSALRKSGIRSKQEHEEGFIPIVDLTNHKMGAAGFNTHESLGALRTYTGIGPAGREVFVQYNLDDPLITLISYGFVDSSAKWVYTVPLTLQSKAGLVMHVNNYSNTARPVDVPHQYLGLKEHFPAVIREGADVHVSKVVIPGAERADTLRAVLAHILKKVDLEGFYVNPAALEREIDFLEKQLIDSNKTYWLALKALVQSELQGKQPLPAGVAAQLIDLCEFYLNHLKVYSERTAYSLKR